MNFYALSGLIIGLATSLSAILVIHRNPRNPKHRAYALYCLSASVWGYFYFGWHLVEDDQLALLFTRCLMVGAIFLPITYLYHVLTLIELVDQKTLVLKVGWTLAGIFFLSNLTPYFIAGVSPELSFPFWPKPGVFFHFYILWFGCYAIYGTTLLIQAYQQSMGLQRNRFLLLAIGSIIAHLGGFTTFPLWYGIEIPPNGAILITVYTSVVAYSLLRYRLLDIGTAMEHGVTYGILMALVALPAYPILLLTQKLYSGHIDYAFSLIEILVLVLMVLCAQLFQVGTRKAVIKLFFRERYDMYETLTKFSKSLLTILDLKDLSEKIVHSLSQAMGIQTVVLYLFDRKKNLYVPASSYGESLSIFPPLKLDTTERLKKALSQGYSSLVREEIEQDGPDSLNIPVLHSLQAMGAEVCLPLINQNRVIGFCALGKRMGNGIYSAQDLNLLSTLAHEAAIALDNALLYEELKRSQALIRRTDRLRSLETIAGGMAHEIRNPLTSIKAFIDLAPGRCHDEEFLTRFGRVVKDDVARIERLTKEILDYARPTEPYLQKEDVNNIVESCLSVLRMRPLLEIITCETSLEQGSLPIFVDRHQIKQVLLNLLFNAVESMEPSGGTLTVQTRKVNQKPEELWVQVEVRDTGPGIAPKDLEHIFDPFFTTKHFSQEYEGTGLGLAMAHQIIQENHGNIEVNSEVGKGTTFFVNLPAYEKEPNFVRGTQESGGMTS